MGADRRRWRPLLAAAVLVGLAACAGPQPSQQAEEKLVTPEALKLKQAVEGLPASLASLHESESNGRFGTIRGLAALLTPILLPLADAEVSAIPATPGLEAFLRQVRRRWLAQERRPFSEAEFRAIAQFLDQYVQTVKGLGGSQFVRFVQADKDGIFTFEKLPAGRWVLATELTSSASAILWTVPLEVEEGASLPVSLGNANLLMEWLKAKPEKEKVK